MSARTSYRPAVMGTHYMAASTHYLATAAATRIFEQGGNAIDAGVAAGLCVATLERDLTDPGGVAPIIIYSARERRVVTIAGLGRWPASASVEYFKRHHGGVLPPGILRSVTPAAPGAWLTALERYGRLSFGQVAQPAIELAEDGFPVFPRLAESIAEAAPALAQWPSSAAIFLPGGRPPVAGEILIQRDLANTFRSLAEAERAAGGDREAGLRAARDCFYKGEIARTIARFCREQGGFLTEVDLASFEAKFEPPVTTEYKGVQVYACGPWTQGPVIPIVLNLLRGFDLSALAHNGPDYLHTLAECFNLAFADREAFIGDPDFVEVPLEGLLAPAYADERRALVQRERAFGELPPAGDPWKHQAGGVGRTLVGAAGGGGGSPRVSPELLDELIPPDTSYVCAVDAEGNMFSATPSDPCVHADMGSPIVPGLGLIISARGSQSRLDERHPASLQPGKRPRLTPNPALALKDGRPFLTFGTPGGDAQTQAMVQVFLNIVERGMDPQQAIEQPRLYSHNFPGSFAPHAYAPGKLSLEAGLGEASRADLAARGHAAGLIPELPRQGGGVCAIRVHPNGVLVGGADPRREAYADGW